MKVLLFVSLTALLLTFLEQRGKVKNGLFLGFLLVTFIEAIHYNYGNDYMAYYQWFNDYSRVSLSWSDFFGSNYYIDTEPGWIFLCHLFKNLGFFSLVAVLSIIQNAIYYFFIKKHVAKEWMVLAFFIYLFDANSLYVINMSMMRQGLTVSLFVLIYMLIKNRKFLHAGIIALVAYTIHSSFIICLPFILIFYAPQEVLKYLGYSFIVLFLLLMINVESVKNLLDQLMVIEQLSDYTENYAERGEFAGYGLGFIVGCLPLFLSIFYLVKSDDDIDKRRLVAMSSISFMILPFVQIIPLAQRMGIYFGAFSIVALPFVFSWIKKGIIRTGVISLYLLIMLYNYWIFFTGPTYSRAFSEFHTIFSQL